MCSAESINDSLNRLKDEIQWGLTMQTKTEATIEDLYHAPDDGNYELVGGRLVSMSPTGDDPNFTAGEIFASLREST